MTESRGLGWRSLANDQKEEDTSVVFYLWAPSQVPTFGSPANQRLVEETKSAGTLQQGTLNAW